jgi:hypothetical protein
MGMPPTVLLCAGSGIGMPSLLVKYGASSILLPPWVWPDTLLMMSMGPSLADIMCDMRGARPSGRAVLIELMLLLLLGWSVIWGRKNKVRLGAEGLPLTLKRPARTLPIARLEHQPTLIALLMLGARRDARTCRSSCHDDHAFR